MKRLTYLLLLTLAVTLSACNFAYGQSRTNRIWRPCPGSTIPASVAISSGGAIALTPCSGQTVTTSGGAVSNSFTTLTTTTTGLVRFDSPSLILSNNSLSNLNINNAIANTITLGDITASSAGSLAVGAQNYFSVPTAATLQLGASNGGALARIDLSRPTSTVTFTTTTLDLASSGFGPASLRLRRTITAGGVTGNATINLMNGTVNFAAAATTITVTNSTVSATSQIIVTPQRLDGTCRTFVVDAKGPSTFNITATAACTAETQVAFWVTN